MSEFCLAPVKREGTTVCRYCYCEIRKPLTDAEIIETCDTWVVDDIGSDEVIKIVRRTELAHGIGEK